MRVTAATLFVLVCLSLCSAQEVFPAANNCVTALCFIQNTTGLGNYQQANASFSIDGNGTAGGTLAAKVLNSATSYQVAGVNVMSTGPQAAADLFVGDGAGANDQPVVAQGNTFIGAFAGTINSTGQANTFVGTSAGALSREGMNNTFVGVSAGREELGNFNTMIGGGAGLITANGDGNTFLGFDAGRNTMEGSYDTYIGAGVAPSDESFTIRIGTAGGSETQTFIGGIFNSSVGGTGIPVYVTNSGQLGTTVSSLRFKEQVRDMGDASSGLLKLRPVTFFYKAEYDKGPRILQYGLIAEEVADVYPGLVAYDSEGKPYSVRYQYLTSMLLNEVQKQYRRAEEQNTILEKQRQQIAEQRQQIGQLKQQLQMQNASVQQRLSRLEDLLRLELAAAK